MVNNQSQRFFSTREFRIGVIAALAVVVLAFAAYLFGTGLRADTTQSVARSPLGSSLTAVRESRLDDYFGRMRNSPAAARSASLAALADSRSNFYADLNNSSAAVRSGSAALSTADFSTKFDIPAAAGARPESSAAPTERWTLPD